MRRFILGLALVLPLCSIFPSYAAPVAEIPTTATITNTVDTNPLLVMESIQQTANKRGYFSMTLLVDGSVLIAGGINRSGCAVNYADVYNVSTRRIESISNMLYDGGRNTTTLLEDGRILIQPLKDQCSSDTKPQLYNPNSRSFEPIPAVLPRPAINLGNGSVLANSGRSIQFCRPLAKSCAVVGKLINSRTNFAATRLVNGDVLITGGTSSTTNAEIYTPSTGAVSLAGTPTATIGTPGVVLRDGRVFFSAVRSGEIYDPSTRTFNQINVQNYYPSGPKYLGPDGKVVILNSTYGGNVYDPTSNTFTRTYSIPSNSQQKFYSDSIVVPNGDIFYVYNSYDSNATTRARYEPSNGITGSLTYPTSWVNRQTIKLAVRASSTKAPITDVGFQTYKTDYPYTSALTWTPYSTTVSPTIDLLQQGRDRYITMFLRDSNGSVVKIGTGMVKFDMTPPVTQMTQLPAYSRRNVVLNWSGTDNLSGIEGYAVEMRVGTNGTWQRVVSNVMKTSAGVSGTHGQQLFFRVRARDVAGNVESYPATYDTQTTIDTIAPTGVLDVSFVGEGSVQVLVASQDQPAGTQDMRVGFSYDFDQATWEPYTTSKTLTRLGAPAGCLRIYGQFRDRAGNVGPIVQVVVPGTGCQ